MMVNILMDNKTLYPNDIYFDEWFFRKINLSKEQKNFTMSIEYSLIKEKFVKIYEELIKEMFDDDMKSNDEKFFFNMYGESSYPSFEELFLRPENNYKLEFFIDFISVLFFKTFYPAEINYEDNAYVIVKLTSISCIGGNFILSGVAQ